MTFICIFPQSGKAQISEQLYKLLPDSLRPADRQHATTLEVKFILKRAFEIDGFGSNEFDQIDKLCYHFAPKYKTIADHESRLDFLAFVCLYLYNSYAIHTENKTTLKSNTGKYKSPHAELGITYCDLYLQEQAKHPVHHPDWLQNILIVKGHFQIEFDLYRDAFYTFQQQIATGRSSKVIYSEAIGFTSLSFLFETLSLPQQALAYLDSGLIAVERMPVENEWAINQKINFLQTRQKLLVDKMKITGNKQLADSIRMMHVEIKQKRNEHSAKFESSSHAVLAFLRLDERKYTSAIAHVDSAFKIFPDFLTTAMGEQAIATKGISLLRLGKAEEGISTLQSLHFNASMKVVVRSALEELYKHELSQNNLQKALEYSNLILQFNNRKHELEIQGKSLEMEQFYNVKARENQIAQLKTLQTRNGLIALFAFLTILSVLGIILIRYRANRAKTRYLLKKVDETMQMQVVQVDEARNIERRLIGQQLHDDLSSSMAATISYLRMKALDQQNGKEKEQYLLMSNSLEEGYKKARDKSHELFLEEDATNFWKRISDQVELLFSGTNISFEFNGDIAGVILSSEAKTSLIMIIKESITNIIKHSKATKAQILLYHDQDLVTLEVNDNGKGFTVKNSGKTAGLRSMRERVAQLNGSINISSAPKNGTIIKIRFPLSAPAS